MPGIAGIIGSGSPEGRGRALESMVTCMMHETFYRCGTHNMAQIGLSAGWVCQQGAFDDCMPVWNKRRDVLLIFSGEDFSMTLGQRELKARGHEFDAGDASYLVHLYEEFGLPFVEKLNGAFSGLVVDFRAQQITLFNDRYGLNRIYFHEREEGFYFSSEAKSLLAVLPVLRQLDPRGLGEFFSLGCVLQNRTLFPAISLLPAGSAWTFAPGRTVTKWTYFKAESWEQQPPLNALEYYDRLRETWPRILARYFTGQGPFGLSLTGGVDSRVIMAWVPPSTRHLACYTFGGVYRDSADVKISREVARICQRSHHTISVGREFLSQFPKLAQESVYISDGGVDVRGSMDLYVQRLARQIAPIRLTGTNGGELLRNLVVFKPNRISQEVLEPGLAQHSEEAALTYAEELKGHKLSFTIFRQAPWYLGSKFLLERSQIGLRMPYFDNDLVALVYQAPAELALTNGVSLRLITDGNAALGRMATDLSGYSGSTPGFPRVLQALGKFTFRAEYAYDLGMPQWLAGLDRVLAPLRLERLFLGRHKFTHFRVWYRDELSQYVKDILLDPRALCRSYLRKPIVEKMVGSHVNGSSNFTVQINKLLSVELIMRHLCKQCQKPA
jgi:asparagine synthase (glutamine-hydrolysing)